MSRPFMFASTDGRLHLLLPVLLVCFAVVTGCRGEREGAAAAEEQEAMYQMGEPLQDSTYAAIVTSEYGTDTLLTEEFRNQYQLYLEQYPTVGGNAEQSRELRRSIVEDFVLRHVLTGEADRLGLEVDPMRVEAQMSQIRSRFPDEEAFQQALAEENITEDSIRQSIGLRLRQQMVPEQMAEAVEEPTAQEVETFRSTQAEQVQVQHILFRLDEGADEEAVRTRARAVLDSARAEQVPFDELARRHSDDGSASLGGQLGYFSRGEMVPPFEEAAFALADSGDVTRELVRTRYGYHIIRLTGRRTGELPDSSVAMRMMMSQRRQEAVKEGVDRLRTKVEVRINPDVVEADLNDPLELY